MPQYLTQQAITLAAMGAFVELNNREWAMLADLFDPPGRRGRPARISRRRMVNAMLFLARSGIQWRYLPKSYGRWEAVWQQWRRWRDNGVWGRAMAGLARQIRVMKGRSAEPSMVMTPRRCAAGGPVRLPQRRRSRPADDRHQA